MTCEYICAYQTEENKNASTNNFPVMNGRGTWESTFDILLLLSPCKALWVSAPAKIGYGRRHRKWRQQQLRGLQHVAKMTGCSRAPSAEEALIAAPLVSNRVCFCSFVVDLHHSNSILIISW